MGLNMRSRIEGSVRDEPITLELPVQPNGEVVAARTDVGIVHWRAPEWAARTVEAVKSAQPVSPRSITVHDNSAFDPVDCRYINAEVKITPSSNIGFVGAANRMLSDWIARSEAEYFLLMSHDSVVPPSALLLLQAAMDAVPAVGVKRRKVGR